MPNWAGPPRSLYGGVYETQPFKIHIHHFMSKKIPQARLSPGTEQQPATMIAPQQVANQQAFLIAYCLGHRTRLKTFRGEKWYDCAPGAGGKMRLAVARARAPARHFPENASVSVHLVFPTGPPIRSAAQYMSVQSTTRRHSIWVQKSTSAFILI